MKKRSFGTHAIAQICQVTPPTIIRWIKEGNLSSFTTVGGHRRVWDTDLAEFLRVQNIPLPEALKHLSPLQILIVDDEPEVRQFVRRALKRIFPEAEVHEAVDGFEAGHKVSSLLPAIVILDIKLPGVDGLKISRSIRSDEKLRLVKILGISGHHPESAKNEVLEAGMDDFLIKPFGVDDLKNKLIPLLSKN